MKTTRIRIYGKITKLHEDYYEVAYKEYTDGRLTGSGTEDFSKERLATATKKFDVYCYNGRVNRAGGRMTDCEGTIRTSSNASNIGAARIVYGADKVARVGKPYRHSI